MRQSEQDIELLFLRTLKAQYFYAFLFGSLRKIRDEKCPTMCVVFSPKSSVGLKLRYNPSFLKEILPDKKLCNFVLAHEGYHLISKVYKRFLEMSKEDKTLFDKDSNQKRLLAADLAANSVLLNTSFSEEKAYITKRVTPCIPSQYKLPENLTFEQYYYLLKDLKVSPESGHAYIMEKLEQLTPEEKELLKMKFENLTDTIKRTLEHFKRKGNIPGELKEFVDFYLPQKINWSRHLFSHVCSGINSKRQRTVRRLKRRVLGVPELVAFPGSIKNRSYKVATIIDTSGSMSSYDLKTGLETCFSLLLHNPLLEIYVLSADVEAHTPVLIKNKKDLQNFELVGRGGTDFIQPIEFCLQHVKPDIIIYFTDSYGTAPSQAPPVPIIWCLTEEERPKNPEGEEIQYGRFIYLKGNEDL